MAHHLKRQRSGHVQPEAPVISLDQPGRLRTKHVLAIAGWSASTLYNRIAAKNFPPPLKDGKSNFWTTEQVRNALGL
jgi:predicted DNA-binding transcriptional regulator AlpA